MWVYVVKSELIFQHKVIVQPFDAISTTETNVKKTLQISYEIFFGRYNLLNFKK